MKTHLAKMKADLKVLALEIKQLKSTRKQCANGYVPNLAYSQHQYRIIHIARCILRGRTLEQIENKVRDTNDWGYKDARKRSAALVASVLEAVNAAQ